MNNIDVITHITIKYDNSRFHNIDKHIHFNPIVKIYNYRYKKRSFYKNIYKGIQNYIQKSKMSIKSL